MGRAEGSVTNPGADANELDWPVRIADVILDLLEGTRREEACRGDRENLFPGRSQAGRHSHEVLLRDTDFHDLARCGLGEGSQLGRAPRIAGHDENIRILTRELQQRRRENLQICQCLFHYAIAASAASSSAIARLNSSSFGTPWCHLATFSIKLTPLPLRVLASTRLGRPGLKGTASSVRTKSSTLLPSQRRTEKPKASNF